jgi:osmotically-inducible protein OsmY
MTEIAKRTGAKISVTPRPAAARAKQLAISAGEVVSSKVRVMQNKKSDAQLQQDVLNELEWDTRVEPTDIGVTVRGGVVTLTGTVTTWAAKLAAAEAAHRVSGVLDVANGVTVKLLAGAARTDADIAAAVRHALKWDVFVPDEQIQSTVSNGVVMLTGHVQLAFERSDAARAVSDLAGVQGVDNRITVDHASVSPDEIRGAIQNALERHADREASRIQIEVAGGRVTLRGEVDSSEQRQAVVNAAWGTRGVDEVVDHLRVG